MFQVSRELFCYIYLINSVSLQEVAYYAHLMGSKTRTESFNNLAIITKNRSYIASIQVFLTVRPEPTIYIYPIPIFTHACCVSTEQVEISEYYQLYLQCRDRYSLDETMSPINSRFQTLHQREREGRRERENGGNGGQVKGNREKKPMV